MTGDLVHPSVAANVVICCPECKLELIDSDGFGFVYCPRCKYCVHPSATNGVCNICGYADEDE